MKNDIKRLVLKEGSAMTKAEKVRYVREKLQLTQSELSKRCGIPMVTLARWENSLQEPRAKQWGKFIEFCESNNIMFN